MNNTNKITYRLINILFVFLCVVSFATQAGQLQVSSATQQKTQPKTLPPTHGTFWGTIRNDNGNKVCGLVLANGQQMFTCNPTGEYQLTVPFDSNQKVTLFSFADGHMPFKKVLQWYEADGERYDVTMKVANDCEITKSICGSVVNFNGGNLPPDWSVVAVSNNAALANDRLEAYTIDGSIRIGADLPIPPGTNELVVKYTAFHPYTVWSTSNQLLFKDKDGEIFQRYLTFSGSYRLGDSILAARINNLQFPTWQNPAAQTTKPFVYDIYDMEWRITEYGARITATRKINGDVVMSDYLSVPVSFENIRGIEFTQGTTTDNNSWLDDFSFSCH